MFKVPDRGGGYATVIHGKVEDKISAKDRGDAHDSSFLADRGCLGAASLPRHPVTAHQH
jgi:hypothetical protein